jgi:hypothetical protein
MNRLPRLVCLLLLLSVWGSASAGSWMRSEGESYYTGSLRYGTGDRYWDSRFKLRDRDCTASNWASEHSYEYGWSYYRTVFVDGELLDRRCGDAHETGFGDLALGVRGRLDPFRNGRTWQVALILPTGYSASSDSSLGHGRLALDLGLAWEINRVPYQPSPRTQWQIGAALRLIEGPPSEQLRGYVKMSHALTPRLGLTAALNGDASLRTGEDRRSFEFVNQRDGVGEYDKLWSTLALSRPLGQWSVYGGVTQVLWGRNVAHETGVVIRFSRRWGS